MKKLLLVVLSIVVFALTGCSNNENLVVLTSSGYEPYEMVDTDGSLTGFDIELMEALAEEANIEIEWLDVNFDGIVASLQTGQYEVAIAGISPTAERDEVIDFSNVYYNSEAGLVNYLVFETETGYSTLSDLDGLTIGAQLGTIQADIISSLSEEYNFTVELRTQNSQLIEEIKIGTIDAVMLESLVADSVLELNDSLSKFVVEESMDAMYGNAIAFTEGSEYQAIFNEALVVLESNGTLEALIDKWFK